jgi:hypothetical protein
MAGMSLHYGKPLIGVGFAKLVSDNKDAGYEIGITSSIGTINLGIMAVSFEMTLFEISWSDGPRDDTILFRDQDSIKHKTRTAKSYYSVYYPVLMGEIGVEIGFAE